MSSTSVLLPLPETPVTQVMQPSGNAAVTFLRLFSRAPITRSQPLSLYSSAAVRPLAFGAWARTAFFRAGARAATGSVWVGAALDGWCRWRGTGMVNRPERYWAVGEFSTRRTSSSVPCATSRPPRGPGAGTDVDEVIGGADRVLVVLDDDDRIAQVAQLAQGGDEPVIVALVQADARFVQDVKHAGQPRADLRGEADALGFAARKRAALAVEVQIGQPDLDEETQPRRHLAHDFRGDVALGGGQSQAPDQPVRLPDRQAAKFADVENPAGRAVFRHGSRIVGGQRHGENFRPQPRSPAGRARMRTHEGAQPVFGQLARGRVEQMLEVRQQPFERFADRRLLAASLSRIRVSTGSLPVPWISAC